MMHGNHEESLSSQAVTIDQLGSNLDSASGVILAMLLNLPELQWPRLQNQGNKSTYRVALP